MFVSYNIDINFALSCKGCVKPFFVQRFMKRFAVKCCVMVLFIMCLHGEQVLAQHKQWGSNLLLEGRVNYGFLINHHLEMEIYNSHFPAFEINLGKETFGLERWQAMYQYPIIGVSYWYSQLGNSKYLGSANAVFPYVNYPLWRNQRQELNFRVGLGLAYLTKRFDRINNYKYIAIGSHLNAAINLMAEYRVRINPRMNASVGLAMMHFSNGSTKTPNYGINTPAVNVAFAYRLSKENSYMSRKVIPRLFKYEFPGTSSVDFDFGTTVAFKDMGNEYDQTFMIYTFTANAMKQISFKSTVGLEADLTINKSDYYIVEHKNIPYEMRSDIIRFGVGPVFHLNMSNLAYTFGLGYYLKGLMAPEKVYFKVGLQYMITPKIYTNLTLRTHFGQADFVGLGVGIKLPYIYSLKK